MTLKSQSRHAANQCAVSFKLALQHVLEEQGEVGKTTLGIKFDFLQS